MNRLLVGAVVGVTGLIAPAAARACTVCSSDRGAQLREGILLDDPLGALIGVVSPFVVLLGAAAITRWGLPGRAGGAA